MADIQFEGKNY